MTNEISNSSEVKHDMDDPSTQTSRTASLWSMAKSSVSLMRVLFSHRSRSFDVGDKLGCDFVFAFTKPKKDTIAPIDENADQSGVSSLKLSAKSLVVRGLSSNPADGALNPEEGDNSLHRRLLAAITKFDGEAVITNLDSSDFTLKLFGVSLSEKVLESEAQTQKLMKMARTGLMLPFDINYRFAFAQLDSGSVFTTAERIRLCMTIFEKIRVEDVHVDDHGVVSQLLSPPTGDADGPHVHRDEHTIADLLDLDVVRGFPLHDGAELSWLHKNWIDDASATFKQPLDHIAIYFGEAIAFYFAWLQHYSRSLMLPAVLGLCLYLYDWCGGQSSWPAVLFSLAMAIWVTVVLKLWKRTQSTLAHDWGVLGYEAEEKMRPQYKGEPFKNLLTGMPDRSEPLLKQMARFMCVTVPVMGVLMVISVAFMAGTQHLNTYLTARLAQPDQSKEQHVHTTALLNTTSVNVEPWNVSSWLASLLSLIPTILFGVGVPALDAVNAKIALWLTDFENHRTPTQFQSSLIAKQALLQFLNNFVALFYIAFVDQDLEQLRSRLVFLLVWKAILNNIQEIFVPMFKSEASLLVAKVEGQRRHKRTASEYSNISEVSDMAQSTTTQDGATSVPAVGTPTVATAARRALESVNAAQLQSQLQQYDPYDDLLEMFVQFGHVTLFAAVFPLAPLLALLNNVIEVHSDAFKLCSMQRPLPSRAGGLGAWTFAFETVGYIACASNVALCGVAAKQYGSLMMWDVASVVLLCVMVEHIFIALKVVMEARISDVPGTLKLKAALEAKVRNTIIPKLLAREAPPAVPRVRSRRAVAAFADVAARLTIEEAASKEQ